MALAACAGPPAEPVRPALWQVDGPHGQRAWLLGTIHALPGPVKWRSAAIDEATVLAVHGLCHLLGHDHGGRGEARAMHRAERRALKAAATPDVPRPYGIDARRQRRERRAR